MKHAVILLIISLLAACLAGCGGAAASSAPAPEAAGSASAETPAPVQEAAEPEAAEVPVPASGQETGSAAEPASPAPEAEPGPASPEAPQEDAAPSVIDEAEEPVSEPSLRLTIGDTEVEVAWEDNESVEALTELVSGRPLTVERSMYGGFEQVGSLGEDLPRDDVPTVTDAGDIVLYSGDQIVIFYGSNSWDYTRLGRITDKTPSEMAELLGNGDVTITLSWE